MSIFFIKKIVWISKISIFILSWYIFQNNLKLINLLSGLYKIIASGKNMSKLIGLCISIIEIESPH